jgi:hypothetical protein
MAQGHSAAVYTQTSDVEGEVNGLMTYDRARLKIDADTVAALHRRLYGPPPRIHEVVPTSRHRGQRWRYTLEKPDAAWPSPDFDDSRWPAGLGMFGRDGTPGVRVGTPWTTDDIWLRREFKLDAIPAGVPHLCVFHDEDAEVYVNGVLAGSFKGWVTSHVTIQMSDEARRALKPGQNVLAVHCHQTGGGQGVDVGLYVLAEGNEAD